MPKSEHLESLIESGHGSANMQVVFSDIENYSKRKSTVQVEIIKDFMDILGRAFDKIGQDYVSYTQARDLNLANDIIKIPTGDGIAVVFTFEGLQKIHLDFAEALLSTIHEHNSREPCEKFNEEGWCNCHTHFKVRIGIHEGKGIIYRDINGNYNVAGGAINIAERIMGLGDGMHILLSEPSFHNLIDMTTDTDLESQFKLYEDMIVKHGVKLDIYQYCPTDKDYVNVSEPKDLVMQTKMKGYKKDFPFLDIFEEASEDEAMEQVGNYMEAMQKFFKRGKDS